MSSNIRTYETTGKNRSSSTQVLIMTLTMPQYLLWQLLLDPSKAPKVVLGLSATWITPPIMLHATIKCIISPLHPGRKHPEIDNLLRGHTSDNTLTHTPLTFCNWITQFQDMCLVNRFQTWTWERMITRTLCVSYWVTWSHFSSRAVVFVDRLVFKKTAFFSCFLALLL